MNFLIAILSYTYENMQQISMFKYKVNVFKYCERYLIAFDNPQLGEFVVHPPPICLATFLILPLALIRPLLPRATRFFAYANYWLENVIFILAFFLYELFLVPVVYGKTFLNIVTCSVGLFTIMFHCVAWFLSGFFFTLFLVLRDIYYLVKILLMHQGCRQAMGLTDELTDTEIDREIKLKVYNEVRETVIEMYLELRKQNGGGEEYDQYLASSSINDLDILGMLGDNEGKFPVFILKASAIHDEWKKRKARLLLRQKSA